jgi:hypothetical protein
VCSPAGDGLPRPAARLKAGEFDDAIDPLLQAYRGDPLNRFPRGSDFATLLRLAEHLSTYLKPTESIRAPRPLELWVALLGLVAMLLTMGYMAGPALAGMPLAEKLAGLAKALGLLPAGMAMVFAARADNIALLREYLRHSWEVDGGPPFNMPSTSRAEAGAPRRAAQIHLILNELETHMAQACPAAVRSTGLLSPLIMTGLVLYFAPERSSSDWLGAGLTCGALLGLNAVLRQRSKAWAERYRAHIRQRLEQSSLAYLIGSGELNYTALADHVPWIMRWQLRFPQLPKAHADELRRVVWQVGFNLDWFLRTPQRYVRWHLLTYPLIGLLGFAVIVLTALEAYAAATPARWWLVLAGGACLELLDLSRTVHPIRVEVWTSELIRYLRERTLA